MRLSNNNFSKRICWFKQPGKIDIEGTIYTYEALNNTYDVAIVCGKKHYQINMNGYTTRINAIHHIHLKIEKYYNI